MAGLFDVWRGGEEQRLVSCTILTMTAPLGLEWLHERTPVILDYDLYDLWLDRSTPDIADLTELLEPYPVEGLVVYPVSLKVNRSGVEGPQLIEVIGES